MVYSNTAESNRKSDNSDFNHKDIYCWLNQKSLGNSVFFIKYLACFIYLSSSIDARERGREWEREEEKHQCERETLMGYLLHASQLRAEPAIQARVLIGNRACNLLVCRTTPNQLCQGLFHYSLIIFCARTSGWKDSYCSSSHPFFTGKKYWEQRGFFLLRFCFIIQEEKIPDSCSNTSFTFHWP